MSAFAVAFVKTYLCRHSLIANPIRISNRQMVNPPTATAALHLGHPRLTASLLLHRPARSQCRFLNHNFEPFFSNMDAEELAANPDDDLGMTCAGRLLQHTDKLTR